MRVRYVIGVEVAAEGYDDADNKLERIVRSIELLKDAGMGIYNVKLEDEETLEEDDEDWEVLRREK